MLIRAYQQLSRVQCPESTSWGSLVRAQYRPSETPRWPLTVAGWPQWARSGAAPSTSSTAGAGSTSLIRPPSPRCSTEAASASCGTTPSTIYCWRRSTEHCWKRRTAQPMSCTAARRLHCIKSAASSFATPSWAVGSLGTRFPVRGCRPSPSRISAFMSTRT